MDIQLNDSILTKKAHPCGGNEFAVQRIGADFKIRCVKCGHEIMIPRSKIEKNIKRVYRDGQEVNKK